MITRTAARRRGGVGLLAEQLIDDRAGDLIEAPPQTLSCAPGDGYGELRLSQVCLRWYDAGAAAPEHRGAAARLRFAGPPGLSAWICVQS